MVDRQPHVAAGGRDTSQDGAARPRPIPDTPSDGRRPLLGPNRPRTDGDYRPTIRGYNRPALFRRRRSNGERRRRRRIRKLRLLGLLAILALIGLTAFTFGLVTAVASE